MKVGIVGAGAVGGLLAARLATAGHTVNVLARGATLAALREQGVLVRAAAGTSAHTVHAGDQPAELGVQDLLIIALKAPALPAVAPTLAPMIDADTLIVPAMNGVPWWFFHDFGGPARGLQLTSVDPGGVVAAALPTAQVIGSVVHLSAGTAGPGVVVPGAGRRLILGEPVGGGSARVEDLAQRLRDATFEVEVSQSIQRDIWYKLWGNMTMNPISALTGATADRVLDDPQLQEFCFAVMREAGAVGERIGCAIAETPEQRHVVTRKLGAFKTSMLQDVEARRPVELDALVGAVREIAQRLQIATPSMDALMGLARVQAQVLGLYPDTRNP